MVREVERELDTVWSDLMTSSNACFSEWEIQRPQSVGGGFTTDAGSQICVRLDLENQ